MSVPQLKVGCDAGPEQKEKPLNTPTHSVCGFVIQIGQGNFPKKGKAHKQEKGKIDFAGIPWKEGVWKQQEREHHKAERGGRRKKHGVNSKMKCNARLAKIAMQNKGRCHEKIHTYHI